MTEHNLLNRIIRAVPRLSAEELQMLLDLTKKAQETAAAGNPLLLRDLNSPPPPADLEGLLARDDGSGSTEI